MIGDRINNIINHLGMNINSFSKEIGMSNNVTIGRIISGTSKPSFEILSKIVLRYCSIINVVWLITGKGEMLIKGSEKLSSMVSEPSNNLYSECKSCKEKDKLISVQEDNIALLKEKLEYLDQKNKKVKESNKTSEDSLQQTG